MSEKWAERIDAMLRKAESTDNEHEAQAFQEKAEELIVKYGIDRAVLEAKRLASGKAERPEEIVTLKMEFTGAYAQALIIMGGEVCRGLGNVQHYQMRSWDKSAKAPQWLAIVGFESDAAQAKLLIESLSLQCVTSMTRWWKSYVLSGEFAGRSDTRAHLLLTGSVKFRMRREFIISFGTGAKTRLARVRDVNIHDSSEPGTEIVLRDRAKAVQDVIDGMALKQAKGLRGGGAAARSAGHVAGQNANTGGTSVGGSRRALG